jgi:glycine cleavage system aminomethyltransferase T
VTADAIEQHLRTRRAAGLFDFSFMGLYEFRDSEAVARVQTRAVGALERGQAAYTLLLNDDGSVFNDATVWNLGDGRWWLFTGRPGDFAWIRDRAEARDRSGEHAILALQGPASGRILARLVGEELVRQLRYFRFVESGAMWIARLGYSGELGYELLVPRSARRTLTRSLLDLGAPEQLCECGFEAADSLRIESGYVLFDREIDGKANPAELGLARLVAPAKAAFASKRLLVGMEIEDRAGSDGFVSADATSECWSPMLQKHVALGFVHPGALPDERVRLADRRAARIVPLPFYDPQRKRPRATPL